MMWFIVCTAHTMTFSDLSGISVQSSISVADLTMLLLANCSRVLMHFRNFAHWSANENAIIDYCTIALMAYWVNGIWKEDSCSVSHNCVREQTKVRKVLEINLKVGRLLFPCVLLESFEKFPHWSLLWATIVVHDNSSWPFT